MIFSIANVPYVLVGIAALVCILVDQLAPRSAESWLIPFWLWLRHNTIATIYDVCSAIISCACFLRKLSNWRRRNGQEFKAFAIQALRNCELTQAVRGSGS